MKWTEDDVDYLILAMTDGESSLVEVADFLGRTRSSISNKIIRLRAENEIHYQMKGRLWTEKDLDYLRKTYGKIPIETIAETLNRTYRATQMKANRLGLVTRGKCTYGHEEEILKMVSEGYTAKQIAKHFQINVDNLRRWLGKNKIKYKREPKQEIDYRYFYPNRGF